MGGTIEQAEGNAEAVAALEQYLKFAKEGHIGYAVVMVGDARNKMILGMTTGSTIFEPAIATNIRKMAEKVEKDALNRSFPPHDPSLGADYVAYNIPNGPLSYDFIAWLIDAEMTRIRKGAPAPLKVHFWMGRDGTELPEKTRRKQVFENVVRPALALIGAVEDPKAKNAGSKEFYLIGDIVKACKAGETVPRLKAPSPLDEPGFHPVTITLRECDHWPHRNSNMDAWMRFARYLEAQGEQVIFIRDTAKVAEPLDFTTCPAASINLHDRIALYEAAKCNLFVSNGPGSLCVFGERPWLMFIELMEDGHPYEVNTPTYFREKLGLEKGDQHPWSGPDQRIVWAPDTYENIVEAWEKLNAECFSGASRLHGDVEDGGRPRQAAGAR